MMDEQLRDNVELLLRGKIEHPSPEFLQRMDALLHPQEFSESGKRYLPLAAIAAATAFALILWIARHESQTTLPGTQDSTVVSGTITLKGPLTPKVVYSTKGFGLEAEQQYPNGIVFDPIPVDASARVQSCLVFILSGLEGKSFEPPKEPKVLAFGRQLLKPRMMGIMVGQELVVENRDRDVHNAHSLPWVNKERNDVLDGAGSVVRYRFTEPERGIKVKCDVTHAMQGKREFHATSWITVLPHPFHAVTDEQGHFEIRGVPPGKYTIEVWQEHCVPALAEVEIGSGKPIELNLALEPRPPYVNEVWDAAPGDEVFKAWQGKAIEVDGLLQSDANAPLREGRKVVTLKAGRKKALFVLAPGVEELLKDFPPETSVVFRGIFKGRPESGTADFVMEDCRLSEAPAQRFWR